MGRTFGSHVTSRPPTNDRARAWQAMRVHRRFTLQQVQMASEIGTENLQRFTRALTSTGFVRLERERSRGRTASLNVYLVVRDTGPLPPICWASGEVFDQNTATVYCAGGSGRKVCASERTAITRVPRKASSPSVVVDMAGLDLLMLSALNATHGKSLPVHALLSIARVIGSDVVSVDDVRDSMARLTAEAFVEARRDSVQQCWSLSPHGAAVCQAVKSRERLTASF